MAIANNVITMPTIRPTMNWIISITSAKGKPPGIALTALCCTCVS